MRLVTKTNLALIGVVAVSAVLNLVTLQVAVMPSFAALEEQGADRNQSRVLEAIQLQKDQVANSAGDYAMWDDTHDFMNGSSPEYEKKNVTAESLETLGVNFMAAVDTEGKVILNKGYDYASEDPNPISLLTTETLSPENPLVAEADEIAVQSALMRTEDGLVVIGYSPILRSDRSGDRAGTLILGRILDIDALKEATKVDFEIVDAASSSVDPSTDEMLNRANELRDLYDRPLGMLISHTSREITAVGERTIFTTLLFLLGAATVLLLALGFVLRKIVIERIENLRSHLNAAAVTGNLGALPEDGKGDELSETLQSFNEMARQLADLRDRLRKQDYEHGAADQAAGLLHNVRNAMSPVSALAWELSRSGEASWKQNLTKAVDQLKDPGLTPDRAGKLNQFVAMSAAQLLEDDAKRQDDLRSIVTMLRHIDDVLKETDSSSQRERVSENIDIAKSARDAARLMEGRGTINLDFGGLHSRQAKGHKVPLDQVLANLLVNAAEAIEAAGTGGRISLASEERLSSANETEILLTIRDDGIGIAQENISRIFEKGFSTKRAGKRGLGLHWCANAINAMGGKIVAESAGAAKGAMFTIILPAAITEKVAA